MSFGPVFPIALLIATVAAPRARLADGITGYRGDDATSASLPPRLSATGLYADLADRPRAVTEGITAYQINTALWSDGSAKERFVSVPPGTRITPTDSDAYVFPEGAVLVKNFLLDTVPGQPASRILVETRFLVRRQSGSVSAWHGISYAWRRDQSDADLVPPLSGRNDTVTVRVGGRLEGRPWRFPARFECTACHKNRGSLAFITPQLDRPAALDAGQNQLQQLFSAGILTAHPAAGKPAAHKWAALDDGSASLELRARSYLAANCSHCHGNGRNRTEFSAANHSFDFFTAAAPLRASPSDPSLPGPYVGKPAAIASDGFEHVVKPGAPDSSMLLQRMLSRGTLASPSRHQMPTLATFRVDSAAVKVIADWICSLGGKPAGTCPLPAVDPPDPTPPKAASVRRLSPPRMAGPGGPAERGRRSALLYQVPGAQGREADARGREHAREERKLP